jgi:invasion protein IalB
MKTTSLMLSLVALLAAHPALAQGQSPESAPDTTQPAQSEPAQSEPAPTDPAPTAPATPEPAAPDATPAPGTTQPAPAEPAQPDAPAAQLPATPDALQQGENYVKETFTDWTLRCVTVDEVEDPCEVHQLLEDQGGVKTAEINIFPLPAGGQVPAGATIVTPLNTLLTQGVSFQIDEGEARRYPFAFCNRIGCVSQIGVSEADLNALRRGKAAKVTIFPLAAPDRPVELPVSLAGFTAAFKALSELPQPTPPAQQ